MGENSRWTLTMNYIQTPFWILPLHVNIERTWRKPRGPIVWKFCKRILPSNNIQKPYPAKWNTLSKRNENIRVKLPIFIYSGDKENLFVSWKTKCFNTHDTEQFFSNWLNKYLQSSQSIATFFLLNFLEFSSFFPGQFSRFVWTLRKSQRMQV